MPELTPPKIFLKFFSWFCHPDLHPFIEGDLLELYAERIKEKGKRKADWYFMIDVFLLFRPGIIKSFAGYHHRDTFGMFNNYLKVGYRNILKYKFFSFINIFGLSMSMSVCMLIILLYADQTSYDQFHTKKERIYRVLMDPVDTKRPYATSPFPLASMLRNNFSIIEETTTLRNGFGGDAIYQQQLAEVTGYFADAHFLNIFDYKLEHGDPIMALQDPNSIIISEEVAKMIFGEVDPIGKRLDFFDRGIFGSNESNSPNAWGSFTITGVLAKTNDRSHLKFDVLVSASSLPALYHRNKIDDLSDRWESYWQSYTYVLLKSNATSEDLAIVLDQVANEVFTDFENLKGSTFIPQSLMRITPGPVLGNAPSITLPDFVYYIMVILALVIMVSAIINYANLSIARAVTRSKEIGIRKVIGAQRKNLIVQFISESMITSLFSLVLANVFLYLLKFALLNLSVNQYLNIELKLQVYVYLLFFGFALVIGLLTGFIPALRLSKFSSLLAMRKVDISHSGKLSFRKVLTGIQFIVSLVFVITTIVIYNQFNYYMQFEYGFNASNVINVNLQGNDFHRLKNELNNVPWVKQVSGCAYLPATGRNDGTSVGIPVMEKSINAINFWADEHFIELLDIPLRAGRPLNPVTTDVNSFVLVNEQLAMDLGFQNPVEAVGDLISVGGIPMEVAGVIENFNFLGPISKRKTGPIVLRNDPSQFKFAMIKYDPGQEDLIRELTNTWKKIDPLHPLEYEFYSERLANNNRGILDIVSIIGIIALLAITIACLGLLGMAVYTTERRTKEIGIRKVLGASDFGLMILLSKEFLVILFISICIAAPLSYFLNNIWLQFLVFRVNIGPGTILIGSTIMFLLGLISIGPQTLKVSNENPVDSIRIE